jgi:hypothetical protein
MTTTATVTWAELVAARAGHLPTLPARPEVRQASRRVPRPEATMMRLSRWRHMRAGNLEVVA